MGDFNMITNTRDQLGGVGSVIRGREARVWARVIRKFKLMDSFHPEGNSLRFSWDNRQIHRHNPANVNFSRFGSRTLKRLDRIYAPANSRSFTPTAKSKILPGLAFSDHAPVVALLKLSDSTRRPSGHRLNVAHLKCPAFRERITALWNERKIEAADRNWSKEDLFQSCMKGTRTLDRCWGKRRALERKARHSALQDRLTKAQLALEAAPEVPALQQEAHVAADLVRSLEKEKAAWVDQILQERWMAEGDRGTKLFFKSFKGMSAGKNIPALTAEDGSKVTTWDSMAATTVNFF